MLKILPVIHYLNAPTAIDQANLAFEAGADGVFLISHEGQDSELPAVGSLIKKAHPSKMIGLNFLSLGVEAACRSVSEYALDMVWGDSCGVSSDGLNDLGISLQKFASCRPSILVFASVAFKYQPFEPDPQAAARQAGEAGFIPTTSGEATGRPPTLEKIQGMSASSGGQLAVASGMSVDNVHTFAPYLSHILVATAVSSDEHQFDYELLTRFVAIAKSNGRGT